MQERPIGEVTVLLQQMRSGDSGAADKLIPLVVDELRRLARLQLRQRRRIAAPKRSQQRFLRNLRCLGHIVEIRRNGIAAARARRRAAT